MRQWGRLRHSESCAVNLPRILFYLFPSIFTNCESSLCLLSYRIDTTLKVEINWNFSEHVAKHFPRKYFSFWLPRNTRSLCACEFSTTESSLGFRDSRKLNCWLSAHWQPITILGICWSMSIFQLLWNCLWIWPICHLPMRILRTSLEQIIMGWWMVIPFLHSSRKRNDDISLTAIKGLFWIY